MFSITRHSRFKIVLVIILSLCLAFIASLYIPLPRNDFSKQSVHSMRVVDRNGVLLREFLNDGEGRGQWKPLNQIASEAVNATIAIEDRRYWDHPGVDPLAILRAIVENIKSGGMRVGGSTLTQQVIRNIYHYPRTLANKALEAWYALRLERMMKKSEILEQYLNRAPYGNQLLGIEAASRYYFQKPAIDVSLAEAAFLAGLPNAPTSMNPYENFNGALVRQRIVLRRMIDQRMITDEEYQRAASQPIMVASPEINFRGPHAVEMARQYIGGVQDAATVQLTIDYPLQKEIHAVVRNHLSRLTRKNVTNAAVVVLDNHTGEIRALVGSADFFDRKSSGQVNGALALRQPGSSIKPFMYVQALNGPITPSTVLPDLPTHIPDDRGDYIPENYDKRYHGPVRLRTALACSYNVPAVRTAAMIGIGTFYQGLHNVGITSLTQPVEHYGYGLALGNAEVSLLELTNAYRTLANGGLWGPITLVRSLTTISGKRPSPEFLGPGSGTPHRAYDRRSVFLVTDILKDPVARRPAFGNAFRFPFPCAVKTGTTKDYRDNWTIGYTADYTVGVWAGNFNNSPMHGVSGVSGAGQIFFDVMLLVTGKTTPPEFPIPDGLVQRAICPRSGLLPGEWCKKTITEWFIRGSEPKKRCDIHRAYRLVSENGTPEKRVYEIFPSEYREWAEAEQIPFPPRTALPIEANRMFSGGRPAPRLTILSPLHGDIFKIDPVLRKEYQSIRITGAVPGQFSDVKLVVNKKETLPFDPSGTWWTLRKGIQRLRLEARDKNRVVMSKAITIEVE